MYMYMYISMLIGLISDVYIDCTKHLNTEESRYTQSDQIKKKS